MLAQVEERGRHRLRAQVLMLLSRQPSEGSRRTQVARLTPGIQVKALNAPRAGLVRREKEGGGLGGSREQLQASVNAHKGK